MRLGNREFIKRRLDGAERGTIVTTDYGLVGVVASPSLLQVYGPAWVFTSDVGDQYIQEARERMAARARRQRLSSAERYNPDLDPRLHPEWDDWEND